MIRSYVQTNLFTDDELQLDKASYSNSVGWEESISNEENKVHEGPELDCLVVAGALGVFARSEAEV